MAHLRNLKARQQSGYPPEAFILVDRMWDNLEDGHEHIFDRLQEKKNAIAQERRTLAHPKPTKTAFRGWILDICFGLMYLSSDKGAVFLEELTQAQLVPGSGFKAIDIFA